MAYIGNSLSTDVGVNQYEYTATSGQTDFACVYDTTVDVYLNGLRLAETDYSKPDGLKVVLAVGATAGDIVTINAFENVATISKAPSDFTVIGDLDVGGTLTVSNIDALGIDADTLDGVQGSGYSLAKLDSGTLFYMVPDGTSRWVRVASWEHTTSYSHQYGVFRIAGRYYVDTFTVETKVTNGPNNGYQAHILQDNPSIAADHIRVLADYSGSTTLVELWIYCLGWGGNHYATLEAYHSHAGVSGITLESGNPAQTTPPTGVSNTHSNTGNLDADTLDGLDSTALGRLATASYWSRTQSYNRVTLTDAATINWDMSISPTAMVTIAGNRTVALPTNIKTGNWYTLLVKQDATGGRTLAWSSGFKFGGNGAPTLSTGANIYDLLTFYAFGTTMLSFVGITNNITTL